MLDVMLPVKLLLERSMTSMYSICPILAGISPVISLFERDRKIRLGMEVPIFLGIGPENLLLDISSNSISTTGSEMGPSKRLELKSMSTKGATFNGFGS